MSSSLNICQCVRSKVIKIYLMKSARTVVLALPARAEKHAVNPLITLETLMLRQPYLEVFKQKYPICNDSK